MHWRKLAYPVVGLCVLLSAVLVAIAKGQDPLNPLSWEMVFGNLGMSIALVFVGLDVTLAAKRLVRFLEKGNRSLLRFKLKADTSDFHPSYSIWRMRFVGCVILLVGLFLLAISTRNTLAALGLIPSPYHP